MRAKIVRVEKHHYRFNVRGMEGASDVPLEGEKAAGPSPKELALAALCGCTGTDVIDLLAKFQVTYKELSLEARANLTDKHPKIFTQIDLTYSVDGVESNADKIVDAVHRSTHQYSGMAAMLSKACPIKYVIRVNGAEVQQGQVDFTQSNH